MSYHFYRGDSHRGSTRNLDFLTCFDVVGSHANLYTHMIAIKLFMSNKKGQW